MNHIAKRIKCHNEIVGYNYRGVQIDVYKNCSDAYKYSYHLFNDAGKRYHCRSMTLSQVKKYIDYAIEDGRRVV